MRLFLGILLTLLLSFVTILFLLSYREHEQYRIVYSARFGSVDNFDIYEISLDGRSRRAMTNPERNFTSRYANDVVCSSSNEAIYVTAGGLYRINRDGTGFTSLSSRGFFNRMDIAAD